MVSERKNVSWACVIELIHTATLVHDDATVTAEEVFSINALWKIKLQYLLFIIKRIVAFYR
jgi:hypothetical protein